jgi:uncharacterized protein (DUF1684 family)
MKYLFGITLMAFTTFLHAQSSYKDSMDLYLKNYVDSHEVVKGGDRNYLRFFDIDESYRVIAKFERAENGQWFQMPTSGSITKMYRVYGAISFTLHDTMIKLNLYQAQGLLSVDRYKKYLFLPFMDATTGTETYESGRYIDLETDDIKNGQVFIDFNKAYNPYCAYVLGYNCPIPPKENHLGIAIRAGEKKYAKH